MGNGNTGETRSRSRPREGAGNGPLPAGGERPPKPTRRPRAGAPVGGPTVGAVAGVPSLDAAAGGTEIGRLLVDHISDAVFSTDATNRVTLWTASAERLFGYSAGEAIGHPFGELLPFGMARVQRRARVPRRAGGRADVAGDGNRSCSGTAARSGSSRRCSRSWRTAGSSAASRSSRDISATVEAQRRLAEEERFINAVLDVAGALVLVLDAKGRVVRFNGACERLTGYASEEVVGRPIWDVVIPPSQGDDVRGVVADLQAGAFPNSHENHWVTRAGALRLIAWENTCLTDDQGAVTHVIATGIDITEARRGDEALHGIETVGRLLAEHGPVPSALDAVLGELEERMGYRFLSLYLGDGDGLRLGAQRGYRAVPERLDAGQRRHRAGLPHRPRGPGARRPGRPRLPSR